MAEENKINPSTGNLDKIGKSSSDITEDDLRYLKLNQTTPQTIINGTPIFNVGLKSNDDVTIKADKKIYLDG
jgi:hypothetical protein